MSQGRKEYPHGRTPAAWAGSILATLGFLVASVGFVMNLNWPIIWVGFAIVAVSVVVGGVMRKLGYGQE